MSSSFIKFTPVSGAFDEQPLCYILQIDQATILLDCGLHSIDALEFLEPLHRLQVDAILLSHADLEHMGGLVYAIKHLLHSPGSTNPSISHPPPIYATLPISNLGRLAAMDHLASLRLHQECPHYQPEDIDAVFESIKTVKYSESVVLGGRAQGITLIPVAAGHTVGGTVWRLKKDTDELVYAVGYNHKKERHLDGTALDGIYRPSLLITDSYNSLQTQPTRKQRDADLIETIMKTLQRDGDVLMPVDASTRLLELVYLLDQLWAYRQLNFPIILLAPFGKRVIDYAKSMLEWMGEGVTKVFATSRETPFDFKFLKICQTLQQAERFPSPKVILTTLPTMDTGISRDLFYAFSDRPQNLILLTTRSMPGTLARYLYDISEGKAERPAKLALTMRKRIPLEGEELAQHLLQQKQLQEQREAERKEQQRLLDGDDDEDEGRTAGVDGLDDDAMMDWTGGAGASVGGGGGGGLNLFHADRFDYFHSSAQQQQQQRQSFFANDTRVIMFPCIENRRRLDDYGMMVDLALFERLEAEQRARYESTMLTVEQMEEAKRAEAEQQQLEEQRQAFQDIPSKYVSFDVQLEFRVQTKFIDFEGLSDGKSIKNILQHIAPKKLILIHGDEENTEDLKQFLLDSASVSNEVFTPRCGESINVSAATNLYQIKLTDSLVSSLRFNRLADYEIAYLAGRVSYSGADGETGGAASLPALQPLSVEDRWRAHRSMIIGDLKLTELKRALTLRGLVADFEKGSLIIGEDRSIRVQKTREGDLMVEGPFCKDYYKIRKMIYRMHAVC